MSSRLLTRAALVAAVLAIGALATASAAFSVVPSPNAFSGDNLLNGVSTSSATDAWAVGSLCCSIRNSTRNSRSMRKSYEARAKPCSR